MSRNPNPIARGQKANVKRKSHFNMAKSKSGGSRAYLRGRIGSDVYSIGKDGKGKKQQVVRSLAEQVSNPRSQSQMKGRLLMSTIMQVVSGLSPIIDHSFDGIAKGQPSISNFIKINYALLKADVEAHPSSSNMFACSKYGEKGPRAGQYVVSSGSAALPTGIHEQDNQIVIAGLTAAKTFADLKAAWPVELDDFFTFVAIENGTAVKYARVSLNLDTADATVLSDANLPGCFTVEGNTDVLVKIDANGLTISLNASGDATGLILSVKTDGGYVHSACTLYCESGAGDWTYDVAIATYPTGNAMYLNGGDIAGGNQSAEIDGGGD